MDSGGSSKGSSNAALSTGVGADFVKKLYKMLGEKQHSNVVRWSDHGGSFIVYDNAEFTKNVLPQHFKHSNFASFVRQLNKYDFHKVRATDDALTQNGDQAWEFMHNEFRIDNAHNLDGIKRKAPAQRPKKGSEEPQKDDETREVIQKLQDQLDSVCRKVDSLAEQYHRALSHLRYLSAHPGQYQPIGPPMPHPEHDMPMHVSPQMMAHPMPQQHPPPQMSTPVHPAATPIQQAERFIHQSPPMQPPQSHPHPHPNGYPDMNGGPNSVGGPVNLSGFGNTATQSGISLHATDPQISTTFRQETRRPQGLRKKSTSGAVHWKEPPKILLVEDDPTCRKIGLKFLEGTGCIAFYASDGFEALKKFDDGNSRPYDLILMDIVMPNLDGVSTCNQIRRARPDMKDPPVIAMTSNIRTTDINLYFNSGMIDVLPKPFTRDGLLQMLQKWLGHLITDPDSFPTTTTPKPATNGTTPKSASTIGPTPKHDIKPSTSPVLKLEFENTTTSGSHADDDDEDDHENGRAHDQETPDSSVGMVPSVSGGGVSHKGHHSHHHHPSGDYTFAEPATAGPGYSGSPGGVEGDMLNASAGIYAPGLGALGAAAGMTSPRGGVRRQMEAGIHDDYDPRMKRMRFNAA